MSVVATRSPPRCDGRSSCRRRSDPSAGWASAYGCDGTGRLPAPFSTPGRAGSPRRTPWIVRGRDGGEHVGELRYRHHEHDPERQGLRPVLQPRAALDGERRDGAR